MDPDSIEQLMQTEHEQRPVQKLLRLAAWLRQATCIFAQIDNESLIGMIKFATLSWHRPDYVIIRQGEIGDCFYVIVRGSVSVYARPSKRKTRREVVAGDLTYARGIQDRMRFGNELAQLNSGRCFGELSVLKKDGERNASIITDEQTVLICFKRKIFLQFVHEKFANELLRKSGFVQTSPLFKKWPSAYKNLLTECLQIRNVDFGETIIEQGDEVNSLYFVLKGQAKLCVNTEKHLKQYKDTMPKQFSKILCQYYEDDTDEDDDIYKFPVLLKRRRKEKEGFFATEMRARPNLDICVLIGENGLIGDLEAVYDLPTYSASYYCLEAITLYELDLSSFIRLIVKKNPDTFETMRRIAEAKLRFRNSSIKGGIPLYAALLQSDLQRKTEKLGLPKLFPRLLVLKQKKDEKKTQAIQQDKNDDRSKLNSRLQKVRMSINPATGEVIVKTTDDSRNSAMAWEENRRRHSIIQREGTRGKILPLLKQMLPNVQEGEESQGSASSKASPIDDNTKSGSDDVRKFVKLQNAAMAAQNFKKGLRKKDSNKEDQAPLEQYKDLKKKMQSLSRTTQRVSWTG
ncbi:uncharacterized protein LOC135688154 isoform X2 [Rhopilema esculentum]|uniref:uncharacterized protein LOC135688154 isoform X2 n=1 Tax=Rhopilema esculentum TaxID=499914 RepID=UPI0031D32348|eukprot:gene7064-12702_t